MRPIRCSSENLRGLFQRQSVATMPEMKVALGTTADLTVFRKLKELVYHSSYSHRGRFYTLEMVAEFDARGLWSHNNAHFSRWGTLKNTVERFVTSSTAGYFMAELSEELQVPTKEPLLSLVRSGQIAREMLSGHYLYCAAEEVLKQTQLAARRRAALESSPEALQPEETDSPEDQLKAAIVLFFSALNEKQRRLYAGLESLKQGHGGDRLIADLLDLDAHTVARGRLELAKGEVNMERVRKPGGGRPPVEKKLRK